MPIVRRIAAFWIALSLILPQHACMHGKQREVFYPLSEQDQWLGILLVSALYLLPLAAASVYLVATLVELWQAFRRPCAAPA